MSTSSPPPSSGMQAPAASKGPNRGYLIAGIAGLLVVCMCGMGIALLATVIVVGPAITNVVGGPTRTPSPLDVRTQWPTVITETFTSNANGWNVKDLKNDSGTTTETIANGKLHIEAKATKGWESERNPSTRSLSDIYLAVRGRVVSGPATARYGLIFRVETATRNDYFFSIADNGTLRVDLYQSGWTNLLDIKSSAIRSGQANQLAVVAQGSHFVLFINDQQVAALDNSQLSSGAAGVAFQLDAGTQGVFDFDNFELRTPAGK